MKLDDPLFVSSQIILAPIDHEKDPEIESKWTHDAQYLRLLNPDPARPLSVAQVKKRYEAIEKSQEEDKNLFYFTIRKREDEHLVGFARLYHISWANGSGMIQLGIGDPANRGKGYGREAMNLMLRYAFTELNLYRLTAGIPDYNQPALHLFKGAGFVEEVRRRQALNRDGQCWDDLLLGLLQEEWLAGQELRK